MNKQTDRAANMNTKSLLLTIRHFQSIQKRNMPGSVDWNCAAEALDPLFREAAKRQQAGEYVPDSQDLNAINALPE